MDNFSFWVGHMVFKGKVGGTSPRQHVEGGGGAIEIDSPATAKEGNKQIFIVTHTKFSIPLFPQVINNFVFRV